MTKTSHNHYGLQIAVLTTSTLSFLLFTILIIGPVSSCRERSSHQCTSAPSPQPQKKEDGLRHTIERIARVTRRDRQDGTPKTWESLLIPPSGGGIQVPQSQIFDPSPDIKADNGKIPGLGIAMFHQLHCLIVLRGVIFPENSRDAENSTSKSFHEHLGLKYDREHWSHCFDYIAQVISALQSIDLFAFLFSLSRASENLVD